MAALAAPKWAAAQLTIEIIGGGADQIPITIVPFGDEDRLPQPLTAVIAADLARSGRFRMQPLGSVRPLPTEPSEVDYKAWKGQGNQTMVIGRATERNDGKVDVRFRLLDTAKEAQLLGFSYTVAKNQTRATAHKIADLIYEKLTGEPGVFSTRIAYVARNPNRFELHVADADGFNSQFILAHREPVISPAWSPDGKQLAYVSFESQKAVVWVQDLGTGARRMVANFRGSNSAPAWSPDGRRLAVTLSQDGVSQLYTLPAAGGTPVRLTSSNSIDTEACYAPKGQHIYFVSDRGGGPQIYRLPANGGAVERVTFDGNYNISPAISPDGRLLAYVSRRNGAFKVMTMELAGGTPQALTDTQDDESPGFAPNGRLLVYATRLQGSDVLMTTTLDGRIKTRLLSSGADVREPAWGPFGR